MRARFLLMIDVLGSSLYEFFDWNYKNRKADRHKVADIPHAAREQSF